MSAMPDAKCSTLQQEVVVAATLESPEPTFPFFMDFQLLFVSEKDPFLGSSKRLALFLQNSPSLSAGQKQTLEYTTL